MNVIEIAKIIKESKYQFFGIRHLADDEDYKIGDIARNSYDWDYENDISSYHTDPIELDGTCAYNTQIESDFDELEEIVEKLNKSIKNATYSGKIAVLGCNYIEYGADENEIIMEDAEVLFIEE